MAEYIERAAVEKMLEDAQLISDGEYCGYCTEDVSLNSIPAADVVEVRHGEWEPGNPICPVCGENKFKDLDADIWADWQPKFCPSCGARMDKEDKHEAG